MEKLEELKLRLEIAQELLKQAMDNVGQATKELVDYMSDKRRELQIGEVNRNVPEGNEVVNKHGFQYTEETKYG